MMHFTAGENSFENSESANFPFLASYARVTNINSRKKILFVIKCKQISQMRKVCHPCWLELSSISSLIFQLKEFRETKKSRPEKGQKGRGENSTDRAQNDQGSPDHDKGQNLQKKKKR